MKVLSLTNEFGEEHFGGAGTAVTGMLRMFSQQGVQQVVVVPDSRRNEPAWVIRHGNIKIFSLPRTEAYFGYLGFINSEKVLLELPELREDWDLIHIHAINFAPLTYALSGGRIPILYSVYSILREELGNNLAPELQAQFAFQEELFTKCQRIHLMSQSVGHYINTKFPELLKRTKVVPLGINPSQERWLGGNPNALLYVGRLLGYKGIEDLIKALYLVKQSGRTFTLDIVGRGADDYENRLKVLVKSQKLGNHVRFHGWQNNQQSVEQWMKASGLLIVPSHKEAYGLVALEGMATGVPLIISKAGGLAELANYSCALTFDAGNIGQLVRAINKALDNPALMHSLARTAQQRAAALEWSKLIPKYLELYSETIRNA
ncbi:MAG: glycosyltransferase family 4 protein [Desulfitobacteriaceae bacterium]